MLRHVPDVTPSAEWLTQPRKGEGTELPHGLEPCGSICVSGFGLLLEPEARFLTSLGVENLAETVQ